MRKLLVLTMAFASLLGAADRKTEPKQPKKQAVITLRVVEASSVAAAANDAADLVPQELRSLLRFSRYHLLDTAVIRGAEGGELLLAVAGDLRGNVKFTICSTPQQPVLEYEVQINRQRDEKDSGATLIRTRVSGNSDETIVLGASRMNPKESAKALIVLLTGRLLP